MLLSIIITTYNRPNALQMVLAALSQQTDRDFEVLIADDGSTLETRRLIEKLEPSLKLLLHHIWQPDHGFKAAQIRNKAAAVAKGDYLIFLDGDSVPLTTFVARHRKLATAKYFVFGNRILLNENFTQQVLQYKIPIYKWPKWRWLVTRLKRQCNRLLPLLFCPFNFWRALNAKSWCSVKACNLGIFKQDFVAVNGFDESYQGWGYEDSDLAIRLINNGVLRKQGRFALPVLHLWHPEYDRSLTQNNLQKLREAAASNKTVAELGVKQYLNSV